MPLFSPHFAARRHFAFDASHTDADIFFAVFFATLPLCRYHFLHYAAERHDTPLLPFRLPLSPPA